MSNKTRFYNWCRKPEPATSKFLRVYAKPVITVTTVVATVLLVSVLLTTTIFSQTMAVSLLNPDSSSSNPTTQPEQTLNEAKPTLTPQNTLNNPPLNNHDSTVQPATNNENFTTSPHIEGYVTTSYMLPFTKAVDGEITGKDYWDKCPRTTMGSQAEFRVKYAQLTCNGYETYKPLDAFVDQSTYYKYREFLIENFADNTQDAGDYWEICIDTKGDSGITPQIDDFRIVITGHNQVTWYQGTSEEWAPLIQPPQNLLQWKDALSASPTSSSPHWICEIRLDDRILENLWSSNVWIRIAAFDANGNNSIQAWPPTSKDKPYDWGTIKVGEALISNLRLTNNRFFSHGDMFQPFVLDGKWTISDEWKYVSASANGGNLVYRQEWNHYSLDDGSTFFVYDYSLIEDLQDTTLDVGDIWQLCIDSLNDGGATPHPDDYRVDIIGHTTAVWYRGNGTGWNQIPSPSPDIFQWTVSLCSSPLSDIPHLIYELKLDKLALFGVVGDYGLRVATYDAHNSGLEAYPSESRIDEPNTWAHKLTILASSPDDRTIPQVVPNPTPTPTPTPTPITIPTIESTPQWVVNFSVNTDVAAIFQTSDEGYVVIGTIEESTTNAFLIKIDSEGKILWNKTYSDPTLNSNIRVFEAIQTLDGGFAFAGRLGSDAWVAKTDSMGNLQWNQTFDHLKNQKYQSGNKTYDYPYLRSCVNSLVQMDNGEYKMGCQVEYIVGSRYSVFMCPLISLDSSGALLSTDWTDESVPFKTSDGGMLKITSGTTLTKFDSTGLVEWSITCPAVIDHIIQSADGGFVTADWDGKEDNKPTTLTKIDADGMTVWTRTIDFVVPLSLLQTDDGYMITGYNCSTYTGVIVKTDLNGNPQWKQEYSNYVEKIINTQDEGFLIATYDSLPNTQRAYSIVKMV